MCELNNIKNLFENAWRNTSFSPERRAERAQKEFETELEQDLKELGENQGNYKEKYISKLSAWLSAKSRCISAWITGPSNFPVRRAEKYRNWEENAWEKFRGWRGKYFKAVNRTRTPSPEEDLDKTLAELDLVIELQEKMKICNKIIRSKKLTDEQKKEQATQYITEDKYRELIQPNWNNKVGFPGFMLTNNSAKIKRLKSRLNVLKDRIERKSSFKPIEFNGGIISIEADRVIIKHDEKPERDVINTIKKRGFRWSRRFSNWSRKHTKQALQDAKNLCGIETEPTEPKEPTEPTEPKENLRKRKTV